MKKTETNKRQLGDITNQINKCIDEDERLNNLFLKYLERECIMACKDDWDDLIDTYWGDFEEDMINQANEYEFECDQLDELMKSDPSFWED